MTTTTRPRVVDPTPVRSYRGTAAAVGAMFLITYITSITAKFALYPPLLDNPDYLVSAGSDDKVLWGAFLEVILIIANIGTAVALFPLLRRRYEGLALAFVTARVMESVFIAVGVLAALTAVTLRQDVAGAGDASSATLVAIGHTLVTLQEWSFNLGPGFVVGVGNGLLLGYMLYRTGLVPRGMAWLGLVGGVGICLSGTAVLFGVIEAGSLPLVAASIPEFFWELSLGIYLLVKGFKPSSLTGDQAGTH
jgi:Domain of unknown function (DUF4386)